MPPDLGPLNPTTTPPPTPGVLSQAPGLVLWESAESSCAVQSIDAVWLETQGRQRLGVGPYPHLVISQVPGPPCRVHCLLYALYWIQRLLYALLGRFGVYYVHSLQGQCLLYTFFVWQNVCIYINMHLYKYAFI